MTQVEGTPVAEQPAPIEPEALTVDKHVQRQPVGAVCQLGVNNRDVIIDAVDQSGWSGTGIAFLEGATRTQVAVANSEYGLFVMQVSWIKCRLRYSPACLGHVVQPREFCQPFSAERGWQAVH